jgi:Tfp pilus assembly PilM family ATPase
VLCGGGASLGGVAEDVRAQLTTNTALAHAGALVRVNDRDPVATDPSFALAIGLACNNETDHDGGDSTR